MWYFDKITAPYNTPVDTPVTLVLGIDKGVIDYIEVEVPDGHCGLTGLYITYNTIQIVPFNKTGFIYGNNRVFNIPLNYPINEAPYQLELFAWNLDDTHPHSFSVGVMMKDKRIDQQALIFTEGE